MVDFGFLPAVLSVQLSSSLGQPNMKEVEKNVLCLASLMESWKLVAWVAGVGYGELGGGGWSGKARAMEGGRGSG